MFYIAKRNSNNEFLNILSTQAKLLAPSYAVIQRFHCYSNINYVVVNLPAAHKASISPRAAVATPSFSIWWTSISITDVKLLLSF